MVEAVVASDIVISLAVSGAPYWRFHRLSEPIGRSRHALAKTYSRLASRAARVIR
jgi:cytochrome c oxidase assembly factor CtaG